MQTEIKSQNNEIFSKGSILLWLSSLALRYAGVLSLYTLCSLRTSI